MATAFEIDIINTAIYYTEKSGKGVFKWRNECFCIFWL